MEQDRLNKSTKNGANTLINLVYVYIFLWLFEGALRRWFLPGLANPLLLIRDPVVLIIYGIALSKKRFPSSGIIISAFFVYSLICVSTLTFGHRNVPVLLYGIHSDLLHLPLIFLIGDVVGRRELHKICYWALLLSIPYTALLVAQFYLPQDAWVNRGVGGALTGAGFSGAEGRFRPPGTFSFITGPAQLYPILMACWLTVFVERKSSWLLLFFSGIAILSAIPISVSRSLFLSVLLVLLVGLLGIICARRIKIGTVFKMLITIALLGVTLPFIEFVNDGYLAFASRWKSASEVYEGGTSEAIFGRYFSSVFNPISRDFTDSGYRDELSWFGIGAGFSSNVGQVILTGSPGFGASENDWGRLLYDNGIILGLMMILVRVTLTLMLTLSSLRKMIKRDPVPLFFLSSGVLLILNGQWMQPTTLGSAIISAGLVLSSVKR